MASPDGLAEDSLDVTTQEDQPGPSEESNRQGVSLTQDKAITVDGTLLENLLKEAASEAAASVTSASAYVDKDFSMDGLEQQIEEMAASNQEKADKAVLMLRASAAAEHAALRAAGAAAAATAAAAVGSNTTKKSADTAGSSQPEAATAAAAPPPEAAATAASTPPSTSTAAAAAALHDEVIEAGATANPRPPTPTTETGLFGVPAHVSQFAGVAKGKKKKKFYKRF